MLIQRFQIQAGVESEFTTLQGSTDEDALLPYSLDAILNPYSAKAISTPSNAPSLRCCKEATERTSNPSSTSTAKGKARRMGFQLQRRAFMDPGREHECGRPLGLKLNHHTGELYVADAYHGLRVVSPDNDDKVSRPVAPQWWRGTGRTFSFANGVEVDPDTGAVYFTETSTRSQRREFLRIVISGDTTGRLLRYDPKSGGEVEVLVEKVVPFRV
ncbi:protein STRICTOSIDINE SYNTHASE-LIKE 10-like isoform X2 [Miscanthus floridulus]